MIKISVPQEFLKEMIRGWAGQSMDYGTEDHEILSDLKKVCSKCKLNSEDTEQVIGWIFDKEGNCTAEDNPPLV